MVRGIVSAGMLVAGSLVSAFAHAFTFVDVESTGAAAQGNVPVSFAMPLRPGDVPNGSSLVAKLANGTALSTQVDIKARHGDASARHAIVNVLLPSLPTGTPTRVNLTSGAAGANTPLSAASLLSAGFSSAISVTVGTTTYSANVGSLLTDATPRWVSGPLATTWEVVAPLTNGSTAHPYLHARFLITAYQGYQRAKVDVVVENTWTYETAAPGPQNFTYNVNVTVGGASVYSRNALTHYRQSRWRKTFWWGAQPQYHVRFDVPYLKATKTVPFYDPAVQVSGTTLANQYSDYLGSDREPMGSSIVKQYMPETGGRIDIAPLPRWTAVALISQDKRAFEVMNGVGDSAGSWPIHYRDKNTGVMVKITDYPYIGLLGNSGSGDYINPATGKSEEPPKCAGTCGTPMTPDSAHQPSLAYVPYLLSGDRFMLEELQFWAGWNIMQAGPGSRDFTKGSLDFDQVRGMAWSLRTLTQAAYISPDNDALKGYFSQLLKNNLDLFNAKFTNNASANPMHLNSAGYAFNSSTQQFYGSWQDDFFTWAVGYAAALGYADAVPLLNWKSKYAIGRMTDPGFCWILASQYLHYVRDASGNFYTKWSDIYGASGGSDVKNGVALSSLPCGSQQMADWLSIGDSKKWLAGEMTGYADQPDGYAANLQPALAILAEAGVTGGSQAWTRFAGRANKPDYTVSPQFAIVPASTTAPPPPPPPTADLAIGLTHEAIKGTPLAGYDLSFLITATNVGGGDTAATTVSMPLPAGPQFVWASPGCGVSAGSTTCTVPSLTQGSNSKFRVVLRPSVAGTLSVSASTSTQDASAANNSASLSVVVASPAAGVPVSRYRLYSPVTLEHLFTTDLNEYNTLGTRGWVKEGIDHRIHNNPVTLGGVTAVPYYRVYIAPVLQHLWTTDANEYYTLTQTPAVYVPEGVDGMVFDRQAAGTVPLYRMLYPPRAPLHHWTRDANEYNVLTTQRGWVGEAAPGLPTGVAAYVLP